MQDEKRPGNPAFDFSHGTVRLASSLFGKLPLLCVGPRRQVLFKFVDELELHAVQILVRLDDSVPEKADEDAEQWNRHGQPAFAEPRGHESVKGHETRIEGKQQAARGDASRAHVLGRADKDLVLLKEVGGESLSVFALGNSDDVVDVWVRHALPPRVNQLAEGLPSPWVHLVIPPCSGGPGARAMSTASQQNVAGVDLPGYGQFGSDPRRLVGVFAAYDDSEVGAPDDASDLLPPVFVVGLFERGVNDGERRVG